MAEMTKKQEEKRAMKEATKEEKVAGEKPKKETKKKEETPKKDAKEKKKPKKEEKKIVKESVHTVNLSKAYEHPASRRARSAILVIKKYLQKHTRKEPFVSPQLNEKIWENSISKPPRKIKIKIVEEENKATAELV